MMTQKVSVQSQHAVYLVGKLSLCSSIITENCFCLEAQKK